MTHGGSVNVMWGWGAGRCPQSQRGKDLYGEVSSDLLGAVVLGVVFLLPRRLHEHGEGTQLQGRYSRGLPVLTLTTGPVSAERLDPSLS